MSSWVKVSQFTKESPFINLQRSIEERIDVRAENASVLRENSIVENNRGKAKLARTPTMIMTMMISSSVKPLLFFILFIVYSLYSFLIFSLLVIHNINLSVFYPGIPPFGLMGFSLN
jgi:hypothetical protein